MCLRFLSHDGCPAAPAGAACRFSHTMPFRDGKAANRNVGDFGGGSLDPGSRRLPISLNMTVARTHMYTHYAKVWDLSLVPRPDVGSARFAIRFHLRTCALGELLGRLVHGAPFELYDEEAAAGSELFLHGIAQRVRLSSGLCVLEAPLQPLLANHLQPLLQVRVLAPDGGLQAANSRAVLSQWSAGGTLSGVSDAASGTLQIKDWAVRREGFHGPPRALGTRKRKGVN